MSDWQTSLDTPCKSGKFSKLPSKLCLEIFIRESLLFVLDSKGKSNEKKKISQKEEEENGKLHFT